MPKKKQTMADKLAEGKKNSKAVDKQAGKNKVNREAKKLSEKVVMEIAADLPAGQGNAFLQLHAEHRKAEDRIAADQKWKRDVRSRMKAIKVDMAAYDRVNKLSKMDPSDVAAKKATEALYEKQLSMPLSKDQEKIVADIDTKRENARAAMSELNGGETGKEVGSGMIGHNSEANGQQAAAKEPEAPALPERNDTIGKVFRLPANDAAAVN